MVCGQIIKETDETVPYKKRTAHKECFNQAIKLIRAEKNEELKKKDEEKKAKNKAGRPRKSTVKAELKDGLTDEEYKEKKAFYDYIKEITGEDKLSAKVYALSEKYIERYGFTWTGMKDTLVYLNEIKEETLTGDVVGIIVYRYEEAQEFFEDVKRVEERNKDVDISKLYTERVIKVKPPKRIIKQLSFDD